MEKEERKEGRRERRITGKRERDNETQREMEKFYRKFGSDLGKVDKKILISRLLHYLIYRFSV